MAALVWLGPPGIDLAAHLYQRALFDERGFTFWNNFWYAGRYSYVNYSLLYYPLAALVGLKALATASVAVGASAFGLTVERLWGGCARWAAWAFAVALAASLILAAFPYTLGLACALVALAALQAHRFKLFGLLVVATFAASPLAFLILAVVLGSGVRALAQVPGAGRASRPCHRQLSGCCSGGSSPAQVASRSPSASSRPRSCSVSPVSPSPGASSGPDCSSRSSPSTEQPVSSATSFPPTSAPTSCASATSRSR